MSYRKIMDAVDTKTGRKIYFVNDARYTFTDSGSHIEEPMTRLGLEIDELNVKCDNMVTELSVPSISYATKERIREEFGEFADIPPTDTFSVTRNNTTITSQFEIGMTWRDYVNSEYNVFNSSHNSDFHMGYVWLDEDYTITLNDYTPVTPDDEIINNQVYRAAAY